MAKLILKKEPRLEAKLQAFSYQIEAFTAIKDLDYSAIFHEQGLGKTKIAIDLLLYWLENKYVDTILLVVKKGLVRNWERELITHSYMRPRVFSQNTRSNYYVFNAPSRLMIAHYEVFRSEKDRLKLFLKARDVAVIVDESAKIKNPNSTLTKIFFELAPLFKKRVIMTGTPVANRPYDLWAQIWFLDQGKSLGNDFITFKRNSDLSNKLANDNELQNQFETTINSIYHKISSFSVRETKSKGIIELPKKIIKTITTDWERSQYAIYRQMQEEMKLVILKNGMLSEDNAESVLKRLLRLVQIASNPRLIDDNYRCDPGKYEYLQDLINIISNKNEKCIVWSSFTDNVDWLFEKLKSFGSCKVHGKLSIVKRNRALDLFLSEPSIHVLVATPQAAKEGLTLTVANHVIFYDRTFSLDDYLQAQDRIHRISQNKTCYIYNLIMSESIDEWVDILLKSKHFAAQLSQGDISLEYYKNQISYDFGIIVGKILGTVQKLKDGVV